MTNSRRIRISEALLGRDELDGVKRVMASGMLTQGAEVAEAEAAFAEAVGSKGAVAVANGTVALELALAALKIGVGDEVITTPFTFFGTVEAILNVGATPVYAEIDPRTLNIDPAAISAAVGPRTVAIMPVHLYGRVCDMTAIMKIARSAGLAVVEDAAQAIGAQFKGKAAGSFGVGCFSLYGSKNIMCGEGGMVTVSDPAVARRLKSLRNHGADRTYLHTMVSSNYRMTDLAAAILRPQIAKLGWVTQRRAENAAAYARLLTTSAVKAPPSDDGVQQSAWHQYTLQVPRGRDRLQASLDAAGIDSRVYYPRPVHRQPALRPNSWSFPIAERASRQVLSLPVHPKVSRSDVRRVAEVVNAFHP